MERLSHVHDCTSNLIFFDQYISDDKKNIIKISNEQSAKAVKTISAPAMIFELNNNYRYYFRSICWDTTLLIGVNFSNRIGIVKEYFENPTGTFVLNLLKKYLQEGCITIYCQNEIAKNPSN
jgi:hypothetical protein